MNDTPRLEGKARPIGPCPDSKPPFDSEPNINMTSSSCLSLAKFNRMDRAGIHSPFDLLPSDPVDEILRKLDPISIIMLLLTSKRYSSLVAASLASLRLSHFVPTNLPFRLRQELLSLIKPKDDQFIISSQKFYEVLSSLGYVQVLEWIISLSPLGPARLPEVVSMAAVAGHFSIVAKYIDNFSTTERKDLVARLCTSPRSPIALRELIIILGSEQVLSLMTLEV